MTERPSIKLIDYKFCTPQNIGECFEDWLACQLGSVSERYHKGDVCLNFAISIGSQNHSNYVVSYSRQSDISIVAYEQINTLPTLNVEAERPVVNSWRNRNGELMLVGVDCLCETSQQVISAGVAIPSKVRVYAQNDVMNIFGQRGFSLELSSHVRRACAPREIGISPPLGINLARQRPNSLIESVLDCVSCVVGKFVEPGGEGLQDTNLNYLMAGFSVNIGDNVVRICAEKIAPSTINIIDVFLSPTEQCARAFERLWR